MSTIFKMNKSKESSQGLLVNAPSYKLNGNEIIDNNIIACEGITLNNEWHKVNEQGLVDLGTVCDSIIANSTVYTPNIEGNINLGNIATQAVFEGQTSFVSSGGILDLSSFDLTQNIQIGNAQYTAERGINDITQGVDDRIVGIVSNSPITISINGTSDSFNLNQSASKTLSYQIPTISQLNINGASYTPVNGTIDVGSLADNIHIGANTYYVDNYGTITLPNLTRELVVEDSLGNMHDAAPDSTDLSLKFPYSVYERTSTGSLNWSTSTISQGDYIPSLRTLRYWNGAYTGSTSSLAYCNKGAFGDAATKGVITTVNQGAERCLTAGDTANVVSAATVKSIAERCLHTFTFNTGSGKNGQWCRLWVQPIENAWQACGFSLYITNSLRYQANLVEYRGRRGATPAFTDYGLSVFSPTANGTDTMTFKYLIWLDNATGIMYFGLFTYISGGDANIFNVTVLQEKYTDNSSGYTSTANSYIDGTMFAAPAIPDGDYTQITSGDGVRLKPIQNATLDNASYIPNNNGQLQLPNLCKTIVSNGSTYQVDANGSVDIGSFGLSTNIPRGNMVAYTGTSFYMCGFTIKYSLLQKYIPRFGIGIKVGDALYRGKVELVTAPVPIGSLIATVDYVKVTLPKGIPNIWCLIDDSGAIMSSYNSIKILFFTDSSSVSYLQLAEQHSDSRLIDAANNELSHVDSVDLYWNEVKSYFGSNITANTLGNTYGYKLSSGEQFLDYTLRQV